MQSANQMSTGPNTTVADGRLGRRTAKNRNVWLWPKSPIPTKSNRIRGRDYQIRISATVVLILQSHFRQATVVVATRRWGQGQMRRLAFRP